MLYSQHTRASVAAFAEIHGASGEGETEIASGVKQAIAFAEREIATQLAPIMPMFQQAQQMAMAAAPKPPLDPSSQVALQLGQAEIARKTELDKATFGAKQAQMAAEQKMEQMDKMMEAQRQQAETARLAEEQKFNQWVEQQNLRLEKEHNDLMAQVEAMKNKQDNDQHQMTELLKNNQDNQTAIIIERMKEAMAIPEPSTAPDVAKSDQTDTMTPLIEALNSTLQSAQSAHKDQQHGQAMEAIMTGIHGILKHQAAPKVVQRDPQGNIVGVHSQLGE